MADQADVRSLEHLEDYLESAIHFRAQLLKEIENLMVEVRRLTNWINEDARQYWVDEGVRAKRRLVECQDALVRCMSYVREEERKPCSEEKKRLKKAEERRSICEQRLRTAKAAAMAWERGCAKNHSKIQRCHDLADSDLSVAINYLQSQIEDLRTYTGLKSSAMSALRSVADKPVANDNVQNADSASSADASSGQEED